MVKEANDFCNRISNLDTPESTRQKALQAGYKTFETKLAQELVRIKVSTQDSPFFRFACVVIFKKDNLKNKEVIADD